MATAKERYEATISKINKKIGDIDDGNKADVARIPELRAAYKQALNAFEIEKADEINAEIDRIERTVELRKKQIAALKDSEHPARVEARDEYLENLKAEEQAIKDEAGPLYEEIRAARDAYLEIVVKVLPIEEQFYRNAREQHKVKFPREAMTIVPHGLPGSSTEAFVQQHHIREKDKEVRAEHFAEIAERYRIR